MLAIVVFLGFWVLLGLGLFFIAIRGGLGGARAVFQTQSRGGRKTVSTLFVVIYGGFGVLLPALFLAGNHARASKQIGGLRLNAADRHGRELFAEHCGVCHTLAAANAVGKVGPNLDTLQPPPSLTINTVANGCLQNAPANSPQTCLGNGTMPSQLVQGKDAHDVAAFIGRVAGKE